MRRAGWIAVGLMVVAWAIAVNVVNALFESDPQSQAHHLAGHIGLALPAVVLYFWLRSQRGDGGVFLATTRFFPRMLFMGLALFAGGACVEAVSALLGQEGVFYVTHEIGWTINAIGMLAMSAALVMASSITIAHAKARHA